MSRMLAVLRGELAATSFGGEVYLAALFLPIWRRILAPLTTRRPHQDGFGFGGHRLHPPYGQKNAGGGSYKLALFSAGLRPPRRRVGATMCREGLCRLAGLWSKRRWRGLRSRRAFGRLTGRCGHAWGRRGGEVNAGRQGCREQQRRWRGHRLHPPYGQKNAGAWGGNDSLISAGLWPPCRLVVLGVTGGPGGGALGRKVGRSWWGMRRRRPFGRLSDWSRLGH